MAKAYTIYIYRALTAIFLMAMAAGCSLSSWEEDMMPTFNSSGSHFTQTDRVETEDRRKVLLLYSAGYNDIKSYLLGDIEELKQGWFPSDRRSDNVMLVYTHAAESYSDFTTKTTPYLIRLYMDDEDRVEADTLIAYPQETISASALQLNRVLRDVKTMFNAGSYGMIFSSHASGFLPPGYYTSPSTYKFNEIRLMSMDPYKTPSPVPYLMPEHDPAYPRVKSIGADLSGTIQSYSSYEMELREFAAAIPMKLDYILFDACLMGCVEVAYELKDKVGKVGFSQAEVLADGLDYTKLTGHLLRKGDADPQAVCEDYFDQYDRKSGLERSATISLVDTKEMDALAAACAPLFEKYRKQIKSLSKSSVQGFGGGRNYFFDLVDMVRSAGATEAELAGLQKAVDNVMPYKNATGHYYSATDRQTHAINPEKFSGFSMHFPGRSESELNKYYRTLSWNIATELVEY